MALLRLSLRYPLSYFATQHEHLRVLFLHCLPSLADLVCTQARFTDVAKRRSDMGTSGMTKDKVSTRMRHLRFTS